MANINKPSYIFRYHTDSQGNLINVNVENSYQVSPVNNIVMLDQIPSETERLIIKGANNELLTECFNMDEITKNTYYCDYNEGKVYFDATHKGKTKIISYYGRGLALISADRVFLPDSLSNGDVVETLQDLIDFGKECLELIKTLGNAVVIIQKLEKNIADGNALNDKLVSNIAIATPLQASLNKDIKDALVFKDQLKEDVADGKVLNTQLNEIVNEGKILKPELDQSLANAQGSIDKINSAGNKSYLISAEQWVANTDSTISSAFTYRLKHDMASENLQVNGLVSGFSTIVPYKTLGVNEILLISDERVNMKVIINASYYNGGADIAEEVIEARKGEGSLKGKIDKIDEQMESIMSGGAIDSNKLKLIAHRGFSISEPENSIPAYIKASQKGFKYVECDVQVTSDGKFYLMHDETLDRTTNGTGRIQEKTSSYINSLIIDGGNGASKYPNLKIPTLEEFLDCCIKYSINPVIELNPTCSFSDEHILDFYNILNSKNITHKSLVISFMLNNITRVRNLDKNIKLCYLADGTIENIQSCVVNKINCIGMSVGQGTLEKVNLSKENNIDVNIWTANTLNKSLELKGFGVDYITTDLITEVI